MQLFHRKITDASFTEEGAPPIIILHGLFGSSDNWLTVSKSFGPENTVYLVDQRNHGQSPHSDNFTYKDMSEDLFELMNNESIPEAVVIGHSMGGKTAMRFAIEHPEKVSKLIVVDIGPKYYPVHHREILDALLSVHLDSYTSRNEIEAYLSDKITDTGTRQFLLKNIYWTADKKLDWRINLKVLDKEIENVGEAITENNTFHNATLFIKGEKSNYIREQDFADIHRLFSPSVINVIPNVGHWVHAEDTDAFTECIKAFLKKPELV